MSDNEKERKAAEGRRLERARHQQQELLRIEEQRRREQRDLEEKVKKQGIGSGDRPKKK